MKARILAKAGSFTDDGYCVLLGFADDRCDPVNYLILSMSSKPDQQDLELDQGGIHIDGWEMEIYGYDLVEDIRETDTGVVVTLIADAAREAGIDQDIAIEMESKIIDGTPVAEAVWRFKERLSWWEQAKAK